MESSQKNGFVLQINSMDKKFESNDRCYIVEVLFPAAALFVFTAWLNVDLLGHCEIDLLFAVRLLFLFFSTVLMVVSFYLRPATFSLERKNDELFLKTGKLWLRKKAKVRRLSGGVHAIRLFKANRWYIVLRLDVGWIAFSYWTESQAKSACRFVDSMALKLDRPIPSKNSREP